VTEGRLTVAARRYGWISLDRFGSSRSAISGDRRFFHRVSWQFYEKLRQQNQQLMALENKFIAMFPRNRS
jgi:hypothetical protein